jgi:hypothetical protein
MSAEISMSTVRVPTALRRVPRECFATLLPPPEAPQPGDVALARLESIGKNTRLGSPQTPVCG